MESWHAAVIGIVLIILLKLYNVLTFGVCTSKNRMDGKVVLVTGGESGIGKMACIDFAKRGAKVIMGSYDLPLAKSTKDEIIALSKNDNIVIYPFDLSSLESVRKLANEIKSKEKKLDVLINNAGAAVLPHEKTKDNLELGLQVNYYGHFLLTLLLIDLLKKSPSSRIIHVSSLLHRFGNLNFNDLNCNQTYLYLPWRVYCDSKLYVAMFNVELAKRLRGTGITTNALHPGAIASGIWRNMSPGLSHLVRLCLFVVGRSAEKGAQTTIHLAVSDEVANVTGKYFAECKEATANKLTEDSAKAKKFWEMSCDLVQIKPEEITI